MSRKGDHTIHRHIGKQNLCGFDSRNLIKEERSILLPSGWRRMQDVGRGKGKGR
jgi:hypothetical protein